MKKKIILFILIVDLVLFGISSLIFNDNKERYISNNFINEENDLIGLNLSRNDFSYVKETDVTVANNKEDLLNILYTTVNSKEDYYDFKCSDKYINCSSDLISILNDRTTLNVVNSLVKVYKAINLNVQITYTTKGDIRLIVHRKYSDEQISVLNKRVDYLTSLLITDNMNDEQKIKKIHDYLTNSITYGYGSNYDNAYGALINGVAVCTGYSDAFSLFMDKLNIKNYKIVSDTHVWNVVFINNEWKHVDVTFDDPSNDYGINLTNYNYFLVNSNKLNNSAAHNFNKDIYSEFV